jgi:hypothetical protein
LQFERTDVRAVTGRGIDGTGIVVSPKHPALISGRTGRHAGVDRRTAGVERHCLGWTTVVGQRGEQRIYASLITRTRETGC